MLVNGQSYDVGDQAWVEFVVTPSRFHPLAESTSFAVTVRKPDGTVSTITSPDPSLTRSTRTETVYDPVTNAPVDQTVTVWVFQFPQPFDQGSDRAEWVVNGKSTAGVLAAVDTSHGVRRPAI